jgi:AbrB family looped-hinge helix DNA binding protein
MSATVTTKGQVTIPKAVRDMLGIVPGSKVDFRRNADGHVEMVKAGQGDRPASRFARFIGHAGPGMSTDEVMRLTRGEE